MYQVVVGQRKTICRVKSVQHELRRLGWKSLNSLPRLPPSSRGISYSLKQQNIVLDSFIEFFNHESGYSLLQVYEVGERTSKTGVVEGTNALDTRDRHWWIGLGADCQVLGGY